MNSVFSQTVELNKENSLLYYSMNKPLKVHLIFSKIFNYYSQNILLLTSIWSPLGQSLLFSIVVLL